MKFNETYRYIKKNSILLFRTVDGLSEVYETNGCFITMFNFRLKEFRMHKRADDPCKYEMFKIGLPRGLPREIAS